MIDNNKDELLRFCISLIKENNNLEKIEDKINEFDCDEKTKDYLIFETRIYYASYLSQQQHRSKYRDIMISGIILIIIPLIVVIYTFCSFKSVSLIPVGMIIFGLSRFFYGFHKYKYPPTNIFR